MVVGRIPIFVADKLVVFVLVGGNLLQSQVHELLGAIGEGHVHDDFVDIMLFAIFVHLHETAVDDVKGSQARLALQCLGDHVLLACDTIDILLVTLLLLTIRRKFESVD